jgi:hypothetical protein
MPPMLTKEEIRALIGLAVVLTLLIVWVNAYDSPAA